MEDRVPHGRTRHDRKRIRKHSTVKPKTCVISPRKDKPFCTDRKDRNWALENMPYPRKNQGSTGHKRKIFFWGWLYIYNIIFVRKITPILFGWVQMSHSFSEYRNWYPKTRAKSNTKQANMTHVVLDHQVACATIGVVVLKLEEQVRPTPLSPFVFTTQHSDYDLILKKATRKSPNLILFCMLQWNGMGGLEGRHGKDAQPSVLSSQRQL